jgi:23S rRNA (adenine2503-C2)-methyltransferase
MSAKVTLPVERPAGLRQPGPSRALPRLPLLSSHSASSLEALLVAAGGSASQARAAVAKVIRHVFAEDRDVPWDEAALRSLGIGAWAHATLLALEVAPSLRIDAVVPAADGTERLALEARDGALLETVIIPGPGRTTVCISSQVGCARACTFCETGALGLVRQLDAGEIVDQIRIARRVWGGRAPSIQNVVFMGMGEPFDNLDEVAKATHLLTDDRGIALSRSRVTVSTVGVADKLAAFFRTCRAELAVSLNAPDDARRSAIMPVNQRFDMATLKRAILETLPRGRKVLFEYVLIAGRNDALEDADALAAWTRDLRCRVNVIPLNPGPDPALRAPSDDRLDAFVARLVQHRVVTLVRRARGQDVGGACGQLAGARRAVRDAAKG